MERRKTAIAIFNFFIFFCLLIGFLLRAPMAAVRAQTHQATLSLSPSSGSYSLSTPTPFDIQGQLTGVGGEHEILVAEMNLEFPNGILEITNFDFHSGFTELGTHDISQWNSTGVINIALWKTSPPFPTTPINDLFTLTFIGTSAGSASISFTSQTITGNYPSDPVIQINASGGSYTITGGPTVTPTVGPTVTPTTGPTVTPTSPPETPTPTPTNIPGQQATLSLSPSSGSYSLSTPFDIQGQLTGVGGEHEILVAEMNLEFPNGILEITNFDFHSGFTELGTHDISQWNSTGVINIALWKTSPPFPTTPINDLFTLTFIGTSAGSASISFTSQTITGNYPSDPVIQTGVFGGTYAIGGLGFKLRFQGVYAKRPDQEVKLIFKQEGAEVDSFSVSVSADDAGIYSGGVSNFDPGTYDIFVKGPAHLQKKFAGVVLTEEGNNQDWSGTKLLAGDCEIKGDSADKVDIYDVTLLAQCFGTRKDDPQECSEEEGRRTDFDFDGDVDIFDLTYISENFGKEGDE